MEFMRVVRKGEYYPCAFYIDGKRVSAHRYHYEDVKVCCHGIFDTFHTTQTKTTWQHRKQGAVYSQA